MDGPWIFTLACPQGHYVTENGYDEDALRTLIKGGSPLRVYCPDCGEHWEANAEQRGMLKWALGWL